MKRSRDERHTSSEAREVNKDQKPNEAGKRYARPGPSGIIRTSSLPMRGDASSSCNFTELSSPFFCPGREKPTRPNILRKTTNMKKLPQVPKKGNKENITDNAAKGGGTTVMEQPGQQMASTSASYPCATSTPGNSSDDGRSSARSGPSCSSVTTTPAATTLTTSEIPEGLKDTEIMVARRVRLVSVKKRMAKQSERDEQRRARERDREKMQKVLPLMAENGNSSDSSSTGESGSGSSSSGSISWKSNSSPTSYLTSLYTGKTGPKPKLVKKIKGKKTSKQQELFYYGSPRICIGELTANVRREHLHEIFSNFGTIVSIEFGTDNNFSTPRRIAFIQYTTPEEAALAVKEMNEDNIGEIDELEISVATVPLEFLSSSSSQSQQHMETDLMRLKTPTSVRIKKWYSDVSSSD